MNYRSIKKIMSELEAKPCEVCGEYPYRKLGAAGYWSMYSECSHREHIEHRYSEEEIVHLWNINKQDSGHYYCDKHNRRVEYYHDSMDEGWDCGCYHVRYVKEEG